MQLLLQTKYNQFEEKVKVKPQPALPEETRIREHEGDKIQVQYRNSSGGRVRGGNTTRVTNSSSRRRTRIRQIANLAAGGGDISQHGTTGINGMVARPLGLGKRPRKTYGNTRKKLKYLKLSSDADEVQVDKANGNGDNVPQSIRVITNKNSISNSLGMDGDDTSTVTAMTGIEEKEEDNKEFVEDDFAFHSQSSQPPSQPPFHV